MFLVDELAAKMAAVQLMTDDEVKAIPQAYEDGEAGFGALKSERGLFPLRAVKVCLFDTEYTVSSASDASALI
jgi:hypothetical protein